MKDYLQIMFSAFELELSFAILRCQDGLDLSDHFAPEKELGNEKKLEALEKGGDEEEDQENRDHEEGGSNANSKPSIWMVSTQVVFSITYIYKHYIYSSIFSFGYESILHPGPTFICFVSFVFHQIFPTIQVDSERLDSKVVTAIQQFKEKRRRTGTDKIVIIT